MERRCKKPKPAASEEQRCLVHDVPDDLLRLILLRLDSPVWLVRAACACKRWRRVVDDGDGGRAFLHLARSLHPPIVVGQFNNYVGGGHEFMPSSQTLIRLSLDFFPREIARWQVADCHGGLVLLRSATCIITDTLVVCDPLSRRYRYIHHPANQTSCHLQPWLPKNLRIDPCVFLLDGGNDDGNISLSNFRVLYCCYYSDDRVSKVYAFSTADGGGWRLVRQAFDKGLLYYRYKGHVIGRVDRSLYLASPAWQTIRVLDNGKAKMEISEVDLPTRVRKSAGLYYSAFTVVHGTSPEPTASPATAYIVHVYCEDLKVFRQIPSSGEWVLEHSIRQLSEATRGLEGHPEPSRWRAVVTVIAGCNGLAVLRVSLTCGDSWLFSLDVDKMQLQVVPETDMDSSSSINPIIYTLPWPQFLSS